MALDLNYKTYGSGEETIVILHGLFGMLDNWHYHAKNLGTHYTVYTLDLRNHGNSPHADEMTYSLMANDLEQFCEAQQLDKIILIGHSMGGKAAMQFAVDFPYRLKKLVVADIAPKKYPSGGHSIYFKAFKEIDFSKMKSRKEAEEAFSKYEQNPGILLFLLKNLEANPEGGYKLKLNVNAIEKAYEHISGKIEIPYPINIPTLFMKGERSNYISTEDEAAIQDYFPNVSFATISKAGHWLHAENPEDFAAKLNTFLAE
jgi:esterase